MAFFSYVVFVHGNGCEFGSFASYTDPDFLFLGTAQYWQQHTVAMLDRTFVHIAEDVLQAGFGDGVFSIRWDPGLSTLFMLSQMPSNCFLQPITLHQEEAGCELEAFEQVLRL